MLGASVNPIPSAAATISGVPITVIRSGQIAGSPIDRYWAPTETPDGSQLTIVEKPYSISRFTVKNIPNISTSRTPRAYHGALFMNVSKAKIMAVDTQEWLAAVEKASKDGADIPAAPLLKFYSEYSPGSSVHLGTAKARKASQAIAYGPVTPEWMAKYVSWM
ncbi:hypothetical protein P691DRAFT_764340 [Macrolepiota fuliginosa MF-IS2]|uniref:Uncharacterized protein n=1 Tax=Macrolepiota fuliginosa MF-IS2 TaxID=1400762 RepID=A0A9P6BZ76_9AGAR|nr:hypothetical protein P691DRAFT_764340 [Macrolepiota fuliginosa MF-IS2]